MNDDHVKQTVAVYDEIASSYAAQIEDYLPEPELNKFITLIPKNAHILDAGCGPGRDSNYFAQRGFRVTGIDLSKELLKIAKKRVPDATFLRQDLRNLFFPDLFFDAIWSCASLHHLQRIEVPKVLQSFFRILKSKGTLFIMVKEGIGEEDIRESLSSGLPRHYVYFKLEELKNLLKESGFIVSEIYTWREEDRHHKRSNLIWLSSFSYKP